MRSLGAGTCRIYCRLHTNSHHQEPLTVPTMATDITFEFKPIPRHCPIPSTLVALIGGSIQNGRTFMLWSLDRKTITIQFPASQDLAELNHNAPVPEWELQVRTSRTSATTSISLWVSNLAQSLVLC